MSDGQNLNPIGQLAKNDREWKTREMHTPRAVKKGCASLRRMAHEHEYAAKFGIEAQGSYAASCPVPLKRCICLRFGGWVKNDPFHAWRRDWSLASMRASTSSSESACTRPESIPLIRF